MIFLGGTALHLEENMKINLLVLTSFHKTSNLSISRRCFSDDGNQKWTKVKNVRAGRVRLLQEPIFCPLSMQICDVLVAVA